MNLDFGKVAISVVSDSAHLGAGMHWVLKRVSSDGHEIVSLKRHRLFFIVGESLFWGVSLLVELLI